RPARSPHFEKFDRIAEILEHSLEKAPWEARHAEPVLRLDVQRIPARGGAVLPRPAARTQPVLLRLAHHVAVLSADALPQGRAVHTGERHAAIHPLLAAREPCTLLRQRLDRFQEKPRVLLARERSRRLQQGT